MLSNILKFFALVFLTFGLLACSDSNESDAPAMAKPKAAMPAADAMADKDMMAPVLDPDITVLEDNGVVHQREIYQNWPQ